MYTIIAAFFSFHMQAINISVIYTLHCDKKFDATEPVGMERLELCRDEEQARLCWLNLLKVKLECQLCMRLL